MLFRDRTRTLLAGAAGFVFIIATSESQAQQILVSATVTPACSVISSTTLDFGAYDSQVTKTADSSFNIQCTAPASADVFLSNGLQPNESQQRQIASSAGDKLIYLLYQDQVSGTAWNGTPKQVSVTAANTATPVTVFAELPSGQPAPQGTYNDTITITVSVTPTS